MATAFFRPLINPRRAAAAAWHLEPDPSMQFGSEWGQAEYDWIDLDDCETGRGMAPCVPPLPSPAEAWRYLDSLTQSEQRKVECLAAGALVCKGIHGGNNGSYWWGWGLRVVATDLLRWRVDLWEIEIPPRSDFIVEDY